MKTSNRHIQVQPRLHTTNACRAFSLMELLVVICIIATTLALLMPSVMKAREAALKTVCQANLRAISVGDINYRTSHREWMVAMDNSLLSSPAGGSNNLIRPDEPAIYQDLWPANIRWCPSLKYSSGYVVSNVKLGVSMPVTPAVPPAPVPPGPVVAPAPVTHYNWGPVNYTRYATFGYLRPAFDWFGSTYYPANRVVVESGYPNPKVWPTYIRMDYTGNARLTYMLRSYRVEGTRPIASDMISSIGSLAHVTAHNGIIGKTNGPWPGDPQGANAAWMDGSVKWHAFPGKSKCYNSYREVASGISGSPIPGPVPDEAFVQEIPSYSYFFPARRGG